MTGDLLFATCSPGFGTLAGFSDAAAVTCAGPAMMSANFLDLDFLRPASARGGPKIFIFIFRQEVNLIK